MFIRFIFNPDKDEQKFIDSFLRAAKRLIGVGLRQASNQTWQEIDKSLVDPNTHDYLIVQEGFLGRLFWFYFEKGGLLAGRGSIRIFYRHINSALTTKSKYRIRWLTRIGPSNY